MQTLQIRLTDELVKKSQILVDTGVYSNRSEVIRDALRRLVFKDSLSTVPRKYVVLFSADFHGNMDQYRKLLDKAYAESADCVILGGDLSPKDESHRTIMSQKQFFLDSLFPLIKEFNKKNIDRGQGCRVFLILGNDDFKDNEKVLIDNEKSVGFRYVHNRCVKIVDDFFLIGYSYVPLTPFRFKDWEKLDLNDSDERKTRSGIVLKGVKSREGILRNYVFDTNDRRKTIEKDLSRLFASVTGGKVVFLSHSPPYGTKLDMISKTAHVGSEAVRRMIETKQPLLTLHGHIHETVGISGAFSERIGKTVSLSAGNDNIGKRVAVVKFDLFNPAGAVREII